MKHTLNKQTKLKIAAIKIIFFALVLNFNALGQELINFETVKPLYEVNDKSSTIDLYSLFYDNQPSLLIANEKTVHTNTAYESLVLELNVSDLQLLNNKTHDFKNIQLIRIIYNQYDNPSKFVLSDISDFASLKAIVFQCDFRCNTEKLKNIISVQTKQHIPIYYLISIPQ